MSCAAAAMVLLMLMVWGLAWREWRLLTRMRASGLIYMEWIERGRQDGWAAADRWLEEEAVEGEDGFYERKSRTTPPPAHPQMASTQFGEGSKRQKIG